MSDKESLQKIWENTARTAVTSNSHNKLTKSRNDDFVDFTIQCANCGREQLSNMNMKRELFFTCIIPQCGHVFCKRCLDNVLLLRKTKFNCPKCDTVISEAKLTEKSPDEIFSDLDTYNRRKVKEVYNKREEDFDSSEKGAEEYRQYEELVEDLIYNLNNGIDVDRTWAIINQHRATNASIILAISERNHYESMEQERVINEQDEEKKRKQAEFMKMDAIATLRSRDEAKQRNSALLGDKVLYKSALDNVKATNMTAESQASTHSAAKIESKGSNFVSTLLFHRPLPRIVRGGQTSQAQAQTKQPPQEGGGKMERLVHLAGGYDYIEFSKRNWQEIVNGIGWLQQHDVNIALSTDQQHGDEKKWLRPWI